MRVAVVGGPRTGKTTYAYNQTLRPIYHTDEAMHLPWEEQPLVWIERLKDMPQFVIEGVQVARCLRKGLEVDSVVLLDEPYEPLTPRQEGLRKGVLKVFNEWREAHPDVPVLEAR